MSGTRRGSGAGSPPAGLRERAPRPSATAPAPRRRSHRRSSGCASQPWRAQRKAPRAAAPRPAETIDLAIELVGDHLEELGRHEARLQPFEDAGFEDVAPDVQPVAARALIARRGAAVELFADDDEAAAALAALREPGEEVARPPL